jgi:perosamine synthetase
MDAVLSCLVNDEIGPGKASVRLEKEVSSLLKGRHALALREYTRAVEIAIRALDLPEGATIAVSALCHPVYPLVARSLGYRIALLDTEEDVPVVSVGALEALIAGEVAPELPGVPAVGAVVADTPLGLVPNLSALLSLGVPVIEDVSMGFGATFDEQLVGTFGHVTIVGLEANHVLTAAGGAIVVSRERQVAIRAKELAAGLLAESRLSDLNAALGITQLAELQKQLTRRQELAERFGRALGRGRHGIPTQSEAANPVWPAFPVILDGSVKDAAIYARKYGVETENSFSGSYLAGYATAEEAALLMRAQGFLLRTLSFPLYPRLGKDQVATIERVLATLP